MKIKLAGQSLELRVPKSFKIEKRPGGWLICEWESADGEMHRRRAAFAQKGEKFWLHCGRTLFGQWLTSQRSQGSETSPDSDLVSQFPGKVRKVLVRDGQEVKKGENLLLIEAMKMEFTIKAPSDGTITTVPVKEGSQLLPGTLLVHFEPTGGVA
jgi:biotin carboxyl carrier protein